MTGTDQTPLTWDISPEALIGVFADLLDPDDPPEWQDFAACAGTDTEAFFPEKGGSTREAKRICQGCEVRAECLQYALDRNEHFGVYGGLSERERRKLKPAVERVPISMLERDAEILRLDAADQHPDVIADEVGVTRRTVERARSRHRENQTDQTAA